MGSKYASLAFSYTFGLILLGFVSSNIDQDKAECSDQVIGLATCLPYVSGQAKAPSQDCCTGLKLVLQKSKKCVCILIKDRNDPSLDLKINLTLALGLPASCHTPANITECIDILHLPPNSPEAKEFEGLDNVKGGNGTSPAAGVSGNSNENGQNSEQKNEGRMRIRKLSFGVEILIWVFTSSLLLTHI